MFGRSWTLSAVTSVYLYQNKLKHDPSVSWFRQFVIGFSLQVGVLVHKVERWQTLHRVLPFFHSQYHSTMFLTHSSVTDATQHQKLTVSFNPLNAELNPICHSLISLGDLTFMGPCIVSIFQYISNKMQCYTVYLYLETALHVSGGTSTHHQ